MKEDEHPLLFAECIDFPLHISSLLKNPILVILSEAKDRISVGDSSDFDLRMTQLRLFQQTANL
jgi:hypothetical protein